MAWKQLIIKTTDALAEEVENWLSNCGALSVSFMDTEDDPIFEPELDKTELWQHTSVVALFDPQDIKKVLKKKAYHPKFKDLEFRTEDVEDQDWERAWMVDYHPMQFGEKLWIVPTEMSVADVDPEAAETAIQVKLDPGLAFGTGTHPTTRMCLTWLDQAARDGLLAGKTILDYGCGSGVLAIAALKLGAKDAVCVDIDPQAIEATLYNAQNNQVGDLVKTYLVKDFEKEVFQSDITLANILAGPLVELAPTLAARTKHGGHISLSGIIDERHDAIVQAYEPNFNLDPATHEEQDNQGWLMFHGIRK